MVQRPCLACGRQNEVSRPACDGCGTQLSAWSDPVAPTAPRRAMRRLPGRRTILLLGLGAALLVALGPRAWTALRETDVVDAGPTWREPATIAAWAASELRLSGVEPAAVEARVERRTDSARRVLVTAHPMSQALIDVVRGVARVLVRGRARGESTGTHVAVIRQGTRVLLLPVGEAASVAASDESAGTWIELQDALRNAEGIPALADEEPTDADDPASADDPGDTGAAVGPVPDPAIPASDPAAAAAPVSASGPTPDGTAVSATGPATAPPETAARGAAPAAPPAPVRVMKNTSGANPSPTVKPGETGVVVFRASIQPGTARALRLDSVSVRAHGSLADVDDIAFVELVRDVDRDGRRGSSDILAGGRQSFPENDGTLSFSGLGLLFGDNGTPIDILVTIDLADESGGGALSLSIPDAGSVSVTDVATEQPCGARGLPLNGPVLTVDIIDRLKPDPEDVQEELERLESGINEGR